jgi:uncharacterized membrane protein
VEETEARRLAKEAPDQLVARMDAGEFMEIPGSLREQLRNAALAEAQRQENERETLGREAKREQEDAVAAEMIDRQSVSKRMRLPPR